MLILSEFDIQFRLPAPTAIVALLHLHPSLEPRLRSGNELYVRHLATRDSDLPVQTVKSALAYADYIDSFGNHCARFLVPAGYLWLSGSSVIDADPNPYQIYGYALQTRIEDLPSEVL